MPQAGITDKTETIDKADFPEALKTKTRRIVENENCGWIEGSTGSWNRGDALLMYPPAKTLMIALQRRSERLVVKTTLK